MQRLSCSLQPGGSLSALMPFGTYKQSDLHRGTAPPRPEIVSLVESGVLTPAGLAPGRAIDMEDRRS